MAEGVGDLCTRCGDCCTAIRVVVDMDRVVRGEHAYPQADIDFMQTHWSEIAPDEAERRLPHLTQYGNGPDVHYFLCDVWDNTSRLCMAHEQQPPVFRGFPFYGHETG